MSSDDVVISVKNVSKCFEMYGKPSHRLFQTLCAGKKQFYKEFWALKDINFEVKRGESVGIIGRNGAGKSTLLQIITGVLTPTTGSVEIKGRGAALLELGSGFNPEFTGKENVYMNASILGLSRQEIDAKYQEIVDFADIGGFVDQPVKTYSSGMMMRLAFAVQASIEPDVLIVDEALGVGDARFQLKCARRMDSLKARGTTLLFVSHSVEQVKSLCSKGLLIDHGRQLYFGDAKEACAQYFRLLFPEEPAVDSGAEGEIEGGVAQSAKSCCGEFAGYFLQKTAEDLKNCTTFGAGGAWLNCIRIYGLEQSNIFHGGEDIVVRCKYSWDPNCLEEQRMAKALKDDISFSFALANKKGEYMFGCNGFDAGVAVASSDGFSAILEISFTMPYLASGDYFATLAFALGTMENHEQQKWYDYGLELRCESIKKNVYGVMHLDYDMKRIDCGLGDAKRYKNTIF
jgi:ABC-type polysaccharide/polyol phosphate transport system ATPase subunit